MRHQAPWAALPLAFVLLGAEVQAQSYADVAPTYTSTNLSGNPASTATSYFPSCPTGVTRTVTGPTQSFPLPTDIAGDVTNVSQNGSDNVVINGNDNNVNYGTQIWTVPGAVPCETCEGGAQMSNITVTEACPCTAGASKTALPGYTTTEMECTVSGTATTSTLFVSCSSATAAISPVAPSCTSCVAVPAAATSAASGATAGASPAPAASAAAAPAGSGAASPAASGSPAAGVGESSPGASAAAPAAGGESGSSPAESSAAAPGGGSRIAGTVAAAGANSTYGGSSTPAVSMAPYAPSTPNSAPRSGMAAFFLTFGLCGALAWLL